MQTKKDPVSMTGHGQPGTSESVHDLENIAFCKGEIVIPADILIVDKEAASERQSRGKWKNKTSTFDVIVIGKKVCSS